MTPGPPPSAPHGTVSAYKRHLRHGENACAECKAAWATYHRERYASLKPYNAKEASRRIAGRRRSGGSVRRAGGGSQIGGKVSEPDVVSDPQQGE